LRTNGDAVGTQPTGLATRVGWVPGGEIFGIIRGGSMMGMVKVLEVEYCTEL
jgi:hypothetical protein